MSTIQTTQVDLPAGMIDLGIGQPAPALLPLEAMREAAAHRLGQADASLLAYGVSQGDGYFRLALAQFLSEGYGLPVASEHLFVTAGASQALDLICTLFTKPGDTILVEEPSYFLALRIFTDHHLNVVSLPVDQDGLVIEALEEQLTQQEPALLYTIPTFHNPAGVSLSAVRRERLVRLSERHGFLIVADEVYHLLAYTTTSPPPLPTYDEQGTVMSLGSFSKILAPGLRLGWIQAKPVLLKRLVGCGLVDSGGGLNPFTAGLVRSALELGLQREQLTRLKYTYRQGTTVLSQALRKHIPSFMFTEPHGGFFVWGQLSEEVNTEALLPIARRYQVGFQPGLKFSSRQGLRNYMRLSFAYYDEEKLREGVQRLARVVGRDLKLR